LFAGIITYYFIKKAIASFAGNATKGEMKNGK